MRHWSDGQKGGEPEVVALGRGFRRGIGLGMCVSMQWEEEIVVVVVVIDLEEGEYMDREVYESHE